MQSVKNPNQTCSIITSRQFSRLSRVLAIDSTNTTRRRTCYRIIIKRSPSYTHGGQITDSGQNLRNYSSESENQGKKGKKSKKSRGYNSKIVSAGKDWREEVLKLDQFYLGFVLQSIRL